MGTDIRERKGRIIFSHGFLRIQASEEVLEALFSVFYPMVILDRHQTEIYDTIEYIGYSKMFDKSTEGELIPQYEPTFVNNNGKVFVSKMEKL